MDQHSIQQAKEHNFHPVYRPDIDGLRALAILAVVIFHAFPSLAPGGFIGVDIFFVISGFLISSIIFKSLGRGDFSFREFFAHRIKRIFPALILVLIAVFALGWFVLLPDEFARLGKHIVAGAAFIQNFALWNEAGYFDVSSDQKPLLHLWSLAIEEQFYLIYPLIVWVVWHLRINVLLAIFVLGATSFGLNIASIADDASKTFFLPHTRFWELLVGSTLAYALLFGQSSKLQLIQYLGKRPSIWLSNFLSVIGFALIVISILSISKLQLFPGWWALLPVTGATFIIFAGHNALINKKILSHRVLVFFGLISYPLYLWHWPLLSFARIMWSGEPQTAIKATIVALSFLLAWVTFRFIEKPIRLGRKHRYQTALLCISISIVGLVGYSTFVREGLNFRAIPINHGYDANAVCRSLYPDWQFVYCATAKPNAPSILLIGDSHSNSLFQGLAKATESTSYNVLNLAQNGCLPFIGVNARQLGSKSKCLDYTNQTMKFIAEHNSIRTVILVSRGPLYLSGTDPTNENAPPYLTTLEGNPDLKSNLQIFQIAMRNTIEKLLTENKQIIFVLDVPELTFDPISCIKSRPLDFLIHGHQMCSITKSEFDERNSEYRKAVALVLRDYPTVKVFDSASQFCDNKNCWAVKNGELLYTDKQHLSVAGSQLVATELVKLLDH